MKTRITNENCEEIMFGMMENDFDKATMSQLLEQIDSDILLKFEWERWKQIRIEDAIDNYSYDSNILIEQIIEQTEDQNETKFRFLYYAAAASIVLLLSVFLFLTIQKNPAPRIETAQETAKKPMHETLLSHDYKTVVHIKNKILKSDKKMVQGNQNDAIYGPVELKNLAVSDSNLINETEILNIPIKTEPEQVTQIRDITPEKQLPYKVTIVTRDIPGVAQNAFAVGRQTKKEVKKVLTNTRVFFGKNAKGETDKIYLVGEDNTFLCINLTQNPKN